MELLSLRELVAPDPRTLVFGPLGLSTGGRLMPDEALEFQQCSIRSADLVEDVPNGPRQSFERLRTLHAYGLLCYDLFTVVDDLCWVVLEQALRDRFIEFYGGQIPLTRENEDGVLPVSGFAEVSEAFRPRGSHTKGWRLRLQAGKSTSMPLSLGPLLRWARSEGLLHGQRNRVREGDLFERMRNSFAHGTGCKIVMPRESSSSICETAELINRLWGHSTPGGRLYPAPIQRDVLVIGWAEGLHGPRTVVMHADGLATYDEPGSWTFLAVRGVWQDNLADFDARYELTTYPTELLWGPASQDDVTEWLASTTTQPDFAEHLDRLFAVRTHTGRAYSPCRPEILQSMPTDSRDGTWYLIRADRPDDAFGHVKHLTEGATCRPTGRTRGGCAAEDVTSGTWLELMEWLRKERPNLAAMPYKDVAVPRGWGYPDSTGQ
jgi:hypothetical protein